MNIILLEKIDNLGNIGDIVNVTSGYGRNFLIPKGKATIASTENIKTYEAKKEDLQRKVVEDIEIANQRKEVITQQVFEITAPCGPEGRLFGSVGPIDVAEACTNKGFEVLRAEVRMPDGPIKEAGEFEVGLHFHADVNANIKIIVLAEEA
jgi:large subunit ribosomal protein L9